MRPRLVPAAAWLCALACVLGAAGALPVALGPLAWLGCLWVPGLALTDPAALRARGRNRLDGLWLPLATGPVLFGLVTGIAVVAGLDLRAAACLAPVLGALAVTAAGLRGGDPADDAAPRAAWLALLATGLVITVVGALPPVLGDSLRLQADARLHLPVVQRVLAGGLPPENPFLAGEPLAYFWFFHVILGGVAALVRAPVEWLPVWLNVQALAVLLLALNEAGRRLGVSPAGRGAALAVFAFGLSPLGFVKLLHLQATHPELNWGTVRAAGSGALFPVLSYGEPRMAAALTKVAITNALPLGLALGAVALLPVTNVRGGVVRWVAVLGAALVHLAAGLLVLAGLGLAGLARVVRGDRRASGFALMGTAALAAAPVLPYAAYVLGPRAGGTPVTPGFDTGRVLDLHLCLAAVWLFSLPALLGWARDPERRARLWAAVPALGLTLFATLIDGNEYKGAYVLLLVLAPVAGDGLARLVRGRVWALAAVLLLLTPNTYLALTTYARETAPDFLPPPVRAALHEASARMPEDAVVWRMSAGTRGYSPWTVDLGRTRYLSDPYALRILGQWGTDTARTRTQELAHAAQGQYGIALSAAARAVAPRPLFVLVTGDESLAHPRFEALLVAAGAREFASGPRFRIYDAPARGNRERPGGSAPR